MIRRLLPLALLAGCAPEGEVPAFDGLPVADPSPAAEECVDHRECDEWGCWVTICGGTWEMGSPEGVGLDSEHPMHTVEQPSFRLQETELTLPAWTACLADGVCVDHEDVAPNELCNREAAGDDPDQPINCIDWFQAGQICEYVGGRLPTEAEWEYAARSRGSDDIYPWGDDEPSPDNVILDWDPGFGSEPVCSVPAGNTEQGLCDMAGNVLEWNEDWYFGTYAGAPTDGSAWVEPEGLFRVMRGGGTGSSVDVRNANRTFHEPVFWYPGLGVRCAR